jgi:hypothetical protein
MDVHPSTVLGARKSAEECEDKSFNTVRGGTVGGPDRKRRRFGEMDGPIDRRARRFRISVD